MSDRIRKAERLYLQIAASQYGLINRAQLRRCGLDKDALRRRVRSGELVPVLPGVYRVAGAPLDELQGPMAATLWAPPDALISHTTAAALRGLNGFRLNPVHLSAARRLDSINGLTVHETIQFPDDEPSEVGGIPLTSAPRMLLEIASMSHPLLEKALDESIRRDPRTLQDALILLGRPELFRRRGRRILGDLVIARSRTLAPRDSELEDMFMRIVRRYQLPAPVSQFPLRLPGGGIRMDFSYPERLIAIECDSYAWHMDRASFESDRQRDLELQGLGWAVLRFTWPMLKWRQPYVADQVLHLYRLRSPRPPKPLSPVQVAQGAI